MAHMQLKAEMKSLAASYLTVASSEALAAGACVLPAALQPERRWEGKTEPPVEAGPAFAGVRARCGLGRAGLGRRGGVRSQLEKRGDTLDTSARQQQEKQGEGELPSSLDVTAGGNRRHDGNTLPHPDPLTVFFVCVCVCVLERFC